MIKFALKRIAASLLIVLGTTVLIYALLLAAPGGPEQKYAANPKYTQAQVDNYVRALGLDKSALEQYCRWLGACRRDADLPASLVGPNGLPSILPATFSGVDTGLLHGDLGYSISDGEPVVNRIGGALVPTLILATLSAVIWLTIAVILGVITGLRNGGALDNATSVLTYVTYSVPTFLLGFALIWVFAVVLDWLPVSGMTDARNMPTFGTEPFFELLRTDPLRVIGDLASHLVLPTATLVIVSIAGDSRYVRQSIIEAMSMEHVRTARSKGLSERRINVRHILRTGLIPFATNLGLAFPFLVGGALVTETIFAWPGIGRLTLIAIGNLDYPLLMGILTLGAFAVAIGNLISDLLYAALDPRVTT